MGPSHYEPTVEAGQVGREVRHDGGGHWRVRRGFPDRGDGAGAEGLAKGPGGHRPADLIFYGVEHRDALERIQGLVPLIRPDGAIWIVRPKGRKEITEAETMAGGKRAGLVDVKVVSFSDTHTAEKFVIPVAKRPRREQP